MLGRVEATGMEPVEQSVLVELAEAFGRAIDRLRAEHPRSSWIPCLSLARRHLLRAAGRAHLEPVESRPGPV